ncbi:MAG TPA: hypothetical protein VFO85_02635 [Vicinamibacteria bacterium]|nr:hypothetical protein [Vicinamibacteria bacterium]
MRELDDLARHLARTVLARGHWTEATLAAELRAALHSDRQAVIRECCRAACEDCRRADPERVDEEGSVYYVHQEPGIDLLVECRSGDIRAALLEG